MGVRPSAGAGNAGWRERGAAGRGAPAGGGGQTLAGSPALPPHSALRTHAGGHKTSTPHSLGGVRQQVELGQALGRGRAAGDARRRAGRLHLVNQAVGLFGVLLGARRGRRGGRGGCQEGEGCTARAEKAAESGFGGQCGAVGQRWEAGAQPSAQPPATPPSPAHLEPSVVKVDVGQAGKGAALDEAAGRWEDGEGGWVRPGPGRQVALSPNSHNPHAGRRSEGGHACASGPGRKRRGSGLASLVHVLRHLHALLLGPVRPAGQPLDRIRQEVLQHRRLGRLAAHACGVEGVQKGWLCRAAASDWVGAQEAGRHVDGWRSVACRA